MLNIWFSDIIYGLTIGRPLKELTESGEGLLDLLGLLLEGKVAVAPEPVLPVPVAEAKPWLPEFWLRS